MSDYISKRVVIELIESKMTDGSLGTDDETFIGGHGLVDDISDLPTLDETEIIRKAFERVVERLEGLREKPTETVYDTVLVGSIIGILKEECGINE